MRHINNNIVPTVVPSSGYKGCGRCYEAPPSIIIGIRYLKIFHACLHSYIIFVIKDNFVVKVCFYYYFIGTICMYDEYFIFTIKTYA